MKSIVALALVAMLGALAAGCQEDKWLGFYYPDKTTSRSTNYLGEFASLEECRDVATATPGFSAGKTDYECTLNCNARVSDTGPLICEKTER
jgi:hypothetical protein